MKKLFSFLAIATLVLLLSSSTALAAPSDGRGKPDKPGGNDGGTSTASDLGIDVSFPQCKTNLPSNFAFGIVGLNGGLATTENECFIDQLAWAQQANGTTSQLPVQLYVNTGNPWDDIKAYNVTTWPQSNVDDYGNDSLDNDDERFNNPYGACVPTEGNYKNNTNSEACSWQYGWNRAIVDVEKWFKDKVRGTEFNNDPQAYKWWLDVEITNSWQAIDGSAQLNNKATLEGMVAYFDGVAGVDLGIYSTNYQWGVIVGDTVDSRSNLYGLDSWLAGARNEKDAVSKCKSLSPLTGTGVVSMVQFVSKNLDYNVSC